MPDPARTDHPSQGEILAATRRDFDAALEGDPSVVFKLKLTAKADLFGVTQADGTVDVQWDFNEARQGTTVELTIEPSAITLARIEARAQIVKETLLAAYARSVEQGTSAP